MKHHELTIKGAILLLDWAFRYVVLTNLGRREFQSIFRNLVSYIWSETTQTKSSIAKFKCQASSRDRATLKLQKFVVEANYVKELKSSLLQETKINIENVVVPISSTKLKLQKSNRKPREEEGLGLKLNKYNKKEMKWGLKL
jgi:hypothetical protein